jgi:hypothetical protein
MILIELRICCKIDKSWLSLAVCLHGMSAPVDVRRVIVYCMMRVVLLYGRAGTILVVAIRSPLLCQHCIASLFVRHHQRDAITFCKMVLYHPWCSNICLPGSCVAQVLLEYDLRVDLSVPLELRGPVLDNLLVVIVQGDFV